MNSPTKQHRNQNNSQLFYESGLTTPLSCIGLQIFPHINAPALIRCFHRHSHLIISYNRDRRFATADIPYRELKQEERGDIRIFNWEDTDT
ncbi:hypothetical protein CEXT_701971 [Caerostris extrusa]|uniref:Uncharacterized protein n=1 Tax=Caerostris extrusa TaxID=172846 RepID=A0AAV4PGY3_CAEEX|nr:hypothetical protein CEXT_701971 [Caerostris extrusa]